MTARQRNWLLYAVAWVPAAVLYAATLALQRHATVAQAGGTSVVIVGAAALGGVGIWWVSDRVPLGAVGLVRFGLTHIALAAVYAGVWTGVLIGWLALVAGVAVAQEVFQQAAAWHFVSGSGLYAIVAGIAYLIRTQARLREQQVAAAEARLQAVRAQINPHFLFNCLHSLSALVRHEPARAEGALHHLGELFRYALDQTAAELVPLEDEWEFTSHYLELERLRLGDRLRVVIETDEEALDCLVPPFVLQPLVENAVRHAVAPRAEGATITIGAHVDGAVVALSVADDGPGADPAAPQESGGYGLKGLRRQLEARWNGRAAVQVSTSPGNGFRVGVTIPATDRPPTQPP